MVHPGSEISQQAIRAAPSDRELKRERLLTILDGRIGAERLILTSPGATSWYLDGARVQVSPLNPAVLAIEVSRHGDRVLAFANEVDRLLAEELPVDVEVEGVPWDAPLLGTREGTDASTLYESDAEFELRAARSPLLAQETARFDALAAECARIMTRALREVQPEWKESELAARIAADVVHAGAEPVVLLVGGEGRLETRHPLPTDRPIGRRAMAVLGARRHGMIVSLTRWVRFGGPDAAEVDRERRLLRVESAFLRACAAGETIASALSAGAAAYGAHGFAPDEWRNHHQGGAAGYFGRDPRATADSHDVIRVGQAFAWNPTASRAKVEDTALLTAEGMRFLTADPEWPTVIVDGLARPVELVR